MCWDYLRLNLILLILNVFVEYMQIILSFWRMVCYVVGLCRLLFLKLSLPLYFILTIFIACGPGSSFGIATDYGLDFRDRIPVERYFPPVQTGRGAHPASFKIGTGSFPRVKCGRGFLLTTHPLLVLRSWKSRAIRLPTLWATPGL